MIIEMYCPKCKSNQNIDVRPWQLVHEDWGASFHCVNCDSVWIAELAELPELVIEVGTDGTPDQEPS